jgi:hypothetical protein
MIFFRAVFKLGASPDSNTTTLPSSVDINWSLSRDNSLLSEDTLEPTVTKAVGIQPLHLELKLERIFVSCLGRDIRLRRGISDKGRDLGQNTSINIVENSLEPT